MISAIDLWGDILLGGKLQIHAQTSNCEFFESALYMKSVSMPLNWSVFFPKHTYGTRLRKLGCGDCFFTLT